MDSVQVGSSEKKVVCVCKSKTKEAQLFLKQLKKLDKMIENKIIEREQWKAIATGTTAQYGGERVQTSGSQQRMADAVGNSIDIEAEVIQCIDNLINTKRDVINIIEQLNATEYDLLHKVYVQYITIEELAEMYGKSYSWATTVHGRALKNVQDILNKRKQEKNV